MNSVVEWRATTAARTRHPDRVALSASVCVCVCVQAFVRVGQLKYAFSFDETTQQKSLEKQLLSL